MKIMEPQNCQRGEDLVLGAGLEPACLSAYAPQTYVSAIPPPERNRQILIRNAGKQEVRTNQSGNQETRKPRGVHLGTTVHLNRFSWLPGRSEEHTSELQSLANLVCRLLLEKKKKKMISIHLVIKKQKIKQRQK